MTPQLELLSGDTLVVSPSQLELIKTCPAMWKWKHIHRRVRTGPSAARDGGKAFDDAMNVRYRQAGAQAVGEPLQALMETSIDTGFAGLDLPLEEYRSATRYKEVVRLYNEHYREELFDVLGVQVPFAVPLGVLAMPAYFWRHYHKACPHEWLPTDGRGADPCRLCGARRVTDEHIYWPDAPVHVVLHGILDLMVQMRDTREVLISDTKTMNDWKPSKLVEWENASQPKAYAWGMQELARRHPEVGLPTQVNGFLLNAVVIRPPYKSENRKPGAKDLPRTEFHRHRFYFTQARLEEWRLDTLAWVEMALGWVARDHFPQNEKHCAMHYGKPCGYLDVCSVPATQRELVLGSDMYGPYERGPLGVPAALGDEPPASPAPSPLDMP